MTRFIAFVVNIYGSEDWGPTEIDFEWRRQEMIVFLIINMRLIPFAFSYSRKWVGLESLSLWVKGGAYYYGLVCVINAYYTLCFCYEMFWLICILLFICLSALLAIAL